MGLSPTCQVCSVKMKVAVVSTPDPVHMWPHRLFTQQLVVTHGKERQPPTLSQLVPASLLVPVKGLPPSCLPAAVQG